MQRQLKILVLTPTNKAADVLTKKLMAENFQKNGLIRFGITEDEIIENSGILKNKSFDITALKQCLLITTIARFLYDGLKNAEIKYYQWDIILFDEASMIKLVEIIYVLYQQKSSKFIIVGDPFQIQPIVKAEKWQAENIYTLIGLNSFTSPKTAYKITNLTTQYRSLPPIGALFSHFSYNGVLTHHRSIKETKLKLKPITIIKFPISQKELYRSRRLKDGGTYHIYSAILTVELALYLSKKIPESLKIGIICPYLAQAKLVEKLLTVQLKTSSTPQIIIGTVHRFQGEEFDIVLNLFNVPPRISPQIFPNRQHIVNVAISRAKDFLILIIPEIKGIEQLKRIEQLIFNHDEIKTYSKIYSSTELEELILEKNFIVENTQIRERHNINVYYDEKTECKYEIRLDDVGVDVQIKLVKKNLRGE
jgi:superfamily I DNA and/or RNA helicase